ncbi:MAG: hypothetical protein LBC19_06580 [Tannerella sp.]|nr:hypothetical protein [Tannerella sp.]
MKKKADGLQAIAYGADIRNSGTIRLRLKALFALTDIPGKIHRMMMQSGQYQCMGGTFKRHSARFEM